MLFAEQVKIFVEYFIEKFHVSWILMQDRPVKEIIRNNSLITYLVAIMIQ